MKKLEGRSLIPEDIDEIINESVIDIDGGYDTPSDMKILSTAILRSSTLHRLQLHYFSFAIPEFITALCHSGCTLRILHLYNNKLSVEDAQQLGVVLRSNRSIDTIIMEKCEISCEAAMKLAVGLRDNKTLRTVNLWDNNIGCDGATSLADALKSNCTLTTLNLWGNNVGDDGATAFADALRVNNTLQTLILVYNNVGDDGGDELVDALELNSGIRNLDLFGNPVDQSIVTEIYGMISNPRSRSYYGGGLNKNDDDDELGIEVTVDDTTGKGCCLGGEESPTGVDEMAGCCWTSSVDVVTDEF